MRFTPGFIGGGKKVWGVGPMIDLAACTLVTGETNFTNTIKLYDGLVDVSASPSNCAHADLVTKGEFEFAFPTPKRIGRAMFFGTNSQGYVGSINPTVRIELRARIGGNPVMVDLGELNFTDTNNENLPRTMDLVTGVPDFVPTLYSHVHVDILCPSTSGAQTFRFAEVKIYEAS